MGGRVIFSLAQHNSHLRCQCSVSEWMAAGTLVKSSWSERNVKCTFMISAQRVQSSPSNCDAQCCLQGITCGKLVVDEVHEVGGGGSMT